MTIHFLQYFYFQCLKYNKQKRKKNQFNKFKKNIYFLAIKEKISKNYYILIYYYQNEKLINVLYNSVTKETKN